MKKKAVAQAEELDSRTLTFSVLVCTVGRTASAVRCIESILAIENGPDEVFLIDQSPDDGAESPILRFSRDPRFRYRRIEIRNKGAALNYGISVAKGDIVLITDDDCIAESNWLAGYRRAFQEIPELSACFGGVSAGSHPADKGYIPHNANLQSRVFSDVRSASSANVLGANMALRREMAQKLGGFDFLLSPGGRFYAGEDRDILIRILINGFAVCACPDSAVVHHGFRNWDQGRDHTYGDWVGIGAMCAKFCKCRFWKTLSLVCMLLLNHAVLPFFLAFWKGSKQKGWLRIAAFFTGFGRGLRTPVNKALILYHDPRAMPVETLPAGKT